MRKGLIVANCGERRTGDAIGSEEKKSRTELDGANNRVRGGTERAFEHAMRENDGGDS